MPGRRWLYARRLFGWAAARDLILVNPFTTIATADFLPPKISRDRVLSDAELALVLRATAPDGGVGYPTAPYTRFLLTTACRRSEAADAVWSEFDLAARYVAVAGSAGEKCQRTHIAIAAGDNRSVSGTAALRGF